MCTREGKCDVTGERRNLCGYCRYQKCVSLGMSKTGKQVTQLTMQKNVSSSSSFQSQGDSESVSFQKCSPMMTVAACCTIVTQLVIALMYCDLVLSEKVYKTRTRTCR